MPLTRTRQAIEKPPPVPGSRSKAREPENRRPGGQRWQALDGTLHRSRKDAMRAKGPRRLPLAILGVAITGPTLVSVPPKRPLTGAGL